MNIRGSIEEEEPAMGNLGFWQVGFLQGRDRAEVKGGSHGGDLRPKLDAWKLYIDSCGTYGMLTKEGKKYANLTDFTVEDHPLLGGCNAGTIGADTTAMYGDLKICGTSRPGLLTSVQSQSSSARGTRLTTTPTRNG